MTVKEGGSDSAPADVLASEPLRGSELQADPYHERLIETAKQWLVADVGLFDERDLIRADELISSLASCLSLETGRRVAAEKALHERAKKDAKR